MQELEYYSPFTGKPIKSQTITQIIDRIKNYQNQQFVICTGS